MPEITYKQFDPYLKKNDGTLPAVFLIHGEEYLYKTAVKTLLDTLIPESDRSLNYEALEGENENIPLAIEKVNTFSLLSEKKVVALLDSSIFYSKQDSEAIYNKAKQFFYEKNIKKAATYFLNYLGLLNLSFDDLTGENRSTSLNKDLDAAENEYLDHMIRFCLSEGLSVSTSGGYAERLSNAIEKGFPKENRFVITAEMVDKRRLLYKCIKEKGLIVDCSVPKGSRKADKDLQTAVLNENLKAILAKSGKAIEPGAYQALCEKTGFDLRSFTGNLEKLINFIGQRDRITTDDVEAVLNRTKVDPIFELTNALSDRNPEKALFFVTSLLGSGIHPLQIAAAITNQLRKLLLCCDISEDLSTAGWHRNMPFNEFKSKVIPLMTAKDSILTEELMRWEGMLMPQDDVSPEKKAKSAQKKAKSVQSDVFVANRPGNAYPIYQMMLKAGLFSVDELTEAMEHMGRVDRLMKTTGLEAKTILEQALAKICQKT